VDAQARDGEIQTDFPQLKIDNGDNRATATGPVNGGGPHMVLNLEHGSIEIRKGVAIPVPPAVPKCLRHQRHRECRRRARIRLRAKDRRSEFSRSRGRRH